MEKKFELGQIVATKGVADKMKNEKKFYDFVCVSLGRYIQCDWGEMSDGDKQLNDEAVESREDRIHASYTRHPEDGEEEKIWIITEWDRSTTTVLFPDEY